MNPTSSEAQMRRQCSDGRGLRDNDVPPGRACGVMLVATALAILIGCSGAPETFTRVAVTGMVTLDDQPIDGAMIRFIPLGATAGPKTAFEIRQGKFEVNATHGPPVGSHRVEIQWIDNQWQHDDEQTLEKLRQTRGAKIQRPSLPDRYHINSTLTARLEVPSDGTAQELTFPLSTRTR